MASEEIRAYYEAADDAEVAPLGRARMADGRRIELTVEDLARLVGATPRGSVARAGTVPPIPFTDIGSSA